MSILCKNTKNKGVGEWEKEKSLQKIDRSERVFKIRPGQTSRFYH